MIETPCDGCGAPCCRANLVELLAQDAYRLSRTLAVPIEHFAELVPIPDDDPAPGAILSGREWERSPRHRLLLRKVADPESEQRFRCPFLLTVGERGRCGVHPIRPSLCTLFPTAAREGLVRVAGDEPCPPGAWRIDTLPVDDYLLRHRRHRLLSRVHVEIVEAWNERLRAASQPSDAVEHLFYVHHVCREVERRSPALVGGPGELPPVDEARATVDQALRHIGWRGDEAARST